MNTAFNQAAENTMSRQEADRLLCEAVKAGDLYKTLRALENGADPNCRYQNNKERPVLFQSVVENTVPAIVEALLSAGADPNTPDYDGELSVRRAVSSNNMAVLTLLLDYGANPVVALQSYSSALDRALEGKNADQLNAILDHTHPQTFDKLMAVLATKEGAFKQYSEVYEKYKMLEAGASFGEKAYLQDVNGNTFLHKLVKMGDLTRLRNTLAEIEYRDVANKRAETPLHMAVQAKNLRAVIHLCEAGADATAQDLDGFTPLDLLGEMGELGGALDKALRHYGGTFNKLSFMDENRVQKNKVMVVAGAKPSGGKP